MGSFSLHGLTRRLDLFTLRLFLTVVDEGQIRRAAVRENIAPSAATKRIQDLEDVVGLRLFDRQSSGVVPNAAGAVLARRLRALFDNLEDMRRELGDFSEGVRGQVTIATTVSIIVQYLAQEIGEFSRNYPLVDLNLRQDMNVNVVRAVVAGEADVGIYVSSKQIQEDALDVITYRTNRLVAVAPRGHPLTEQPQVDFAELLREPFIAISSATTMMADVQNAAHERGLTLRTRFTVDSVDAARSLVEAGLGVTIQPDCMLDAAAHPRIAMLTFDEPWALRPVVIGTRRDKAITAATRLLISQLTEQPRGADANQG